VKGVDLQILEPFHPVEGSLEAILSLNTLQSVRDFNRLGITEK